MTARATATLVVALLALGSQTSSADIQDSCIVRSIKQTGDTIKVALDVDRGAVAEQLRGSARGALARFQDVTIGDVRLAVLDPATLHIDADVVARIANGRIEIKATLGARVKIAVDGTVVRVKLLSDTLTINGQTVPLRGAFPEVSSDITPPDLGGTLQNVRISDPGRSWLEVELQVQAPPAPPPPPEPEPAVDADR